jgi:hypothetical protein
MSYPIESPQRTPCGLRRLIFRGIAPCQICPDPTQTNQTQNDTPSSDPSDPFDPANLRYDPSDTAHAAERIWTPGQISLRKPRSQEFFRAHHDPGFQLLGATLELKDEREYYFVTPNIATAYPYEVKPVLFVLCINVSGAVFIWPVPQPGERQNSWHIAAREACKRAMTTWIRMVPEHSGANYMIFEGRGMPEPKWPALSFTETLKFAAGYNGLIDNHDHPVLRRLSGVA